MQERTASLLWMTVLIVIAGLVGVGLWQTSGVDPMLIVVDKTFKRIMGTDCKISVTVPIDRRDVAVEAIDKAERALRNVEKDMSTRIDSSDLSSLNSSTPGEPVFIGADTLAVLNLSRQFTDLTDGAFNPTYSPVFLQWKYSAREGRLPTDEELAKASEASGWRQFDIQHDAVIRNHENARIDLGAIAKGWAVDRAIDVMRQAGVTGALVNAGGDVRCFGTNIYGQPWLIGIKDPFDPAPKSLLGALRLTDKAVCTSGNYERFSVIEGEQYSHIVDPHTGRPAEAAPSVTVVAPTAAEADAWATALSVLGPDGLTLIKSADGVEAMLVIGTKDNYRFVRTDGFDALLVGKLKLPPASTAPGDPRTTKRRHDSSVRQLIVGINTGLTNGEQTHVRIKQW